MKNYRHNYLRFTLATLLCLVVALCPCHAQEEVNRGSDSLLARVAVASEDTSMEISREVALKDKELKLKKLELTKKRNENIFFGLGIFFLLITTFILYRNINTQKKLNEAINKLASDQEETIESRTEALREANQQLLALVQFNVHNIREPLTRIMGLMNLKEDVTHDEFENTCLPMMEKAANDLDKTLRDVVRIAEETTKRSPK